MSTCAAAVIDVELIDISIIPAHGGHPILFHTALTPLILEISLSRRP